MKPLELNELVCPKKEEIDWDSFDLYTLFFRILIANKFKLDV